MRFSTLLRLCSFLSLSGSLFAQAGPRTMRFLPLGDSPPYRQEIRDGVAYEQEPPAGSIPPREVVFGANTTGNDESPLSLGRVSAPLKVAPGVGVLSLRRKGEGEKTAAWLNVEKPEKGDFLVLLWRDPDKKSWDAPRALVLPDSAEVAPEGTVRVVNISPVTLAIIFEGDKIQLPVGKTWQKAIPTGKDATIQVGAVDASGNLRRIHSGSVFQNAGERTLVAVYKADGVDPRRALKAIVQREPVDPAKR
ncbi:hypothetical protein [Luteolibacter luteus]|uniref:Uncharacterized protein n=1 Tax=Luteolibacter luteus TaxID=2728835 RepID=A0A858RIN1_9BACT|nr:hypothetical protein [Luteolibacter luteus]QJE96080.1 hypothetical protein HHL09_09885 [Luteolibacter luteus]